MRFDTAAAERQELFQRKKEAANSPHDQGQR